MITIRNDNDNQYHNCRTYLLHIKREVKKFVKKGIVKINILKKIQIEFISLKLKYLFFIY